MTFTYLNRPETLDKLKKEAYDIVIIGGGITGAGLALQAQASGFKTALLEKQDFSQGSSSRTTKLVHGGIRYLKTFDIELVEDTVQERAVLQNIAPHLLHPQMFLMPIYEDEGVTFSLRQAEWAMRIYDWIAGFEEGSPYYHRLLTAEEVLERQPGLKADGLQGGGLYLDYQSDDSRLTIENIKRAVADGANCVSRVEAKEFIYDGQGQIKAVQVQDLLSGEAFQVQGKIFINAAGPWVDQVNQRDPQGQLDEQMAPTKGVHLIVDSSRFKVDQPLYLDSGQGDDRMFFILPQGDKTFIGTTDTSFKGKLEEPLVTSTDVAYLLKSVNHYFKDLDLQVSDIESTDAGLRPLIDPHSGQADVDVVSGASLFESPSAVSRGSDLKISESALVVLAGGKLTDYRHMAEGAMAKVADLYGQATGDYKDLVDSKEYALSGGDFFYEDSDQVFEQLAAQAEAAGLDAGTSQALAQFYGTNLDRVLSYMDPAIHYAEKYGLPLAVALALIYGIYEESVYTALDFFRRRTPYFLFKSTEMEALAPAVFQVLQDELRLSEEELAIQKQDYTEALSFSKLNHLNHK